MSKGIREAALSSEEKEPETKTDGFYNDSDYHRDPYDWGNGYGYGYPTRVLSEQEKEEMKKQNDRTMQSYGSEFLEPEDFKVTVAISIDKLGSIGDPMDVDYDNDKMLQAAESKGLEKLDILIPNASKTYDITISSEESIDNVEVSMTLSAK